MEGRKGFGMNVWPANKFTPLLSLHVIVKITAFNPHLNTTSSLKTQRGPPADFQDQIRCLFNLDDCFFVFCFYRFCNYKSLIVFDCINSQGCRQDVRITTHTTCV